MKRAFRDLYINHLVANYLLVPLECETKLLIDWAKLKYNYDSDN
ncbi:hypothetical protein HMPREF2532_00202 [Bacteroides ovatus]|nr:hypothetical protein HMPREF2532_00202 [Bacteroides ovatus]CAG9880153.1 hypothetical protein BOVA115_4180 [Bacteroides ovatus]CAG9884780.1 hypothetical protein BOVA711_5265 [Bacteroides ovatus]CAG9914599.1 hypothetical protein BOVA435_1981 [Bacteroides ovatus]CAG9918715.1 hypothetical protein BOVAB4_3576 [Bacteroides ovatus]